MRTRNKAVVGPGVLMAFCYWIRFWMWTVVVAAAPLGLVWADDKSGPEQPPTASSSGDTPRKPNKDESAEKPAGSPDKLGVSSTVPRDPAAELLGKLKPENLQAVAEMIERDWPDRPEWAEMALAVMRGRAMQPGMGWWKATEKKYGWTWLKRKLDADSNNIIVRDEFGKDVPYGDLYFDRLDRDLNGKITAADFDVSVFSGSNPAALKARLSETLFYRLDANSNGQITLDELSDFFMRADREASSFLTVEDILAALDDGESRQPPSNDEGPSIGDLLGMFFSGQLGWFGEGPPLGEVAPDFILARHDQSGTLRLGDSRDKKPVVLIFGSFT